MKTDALVETAIATNPGTPQVPPFSHERAPGGLEIAFAIKPPIGKYVPPAPPVPILKNYAVNHDIISNKWHLATGNQELIYHLGRKKYFVEEDLGLDKASTDFLHTENFILVDKRKHIRGIYNGLNKTSIQQLIADIKTLSKE